MNFSFSLFHIFPSHRLLSHYLFSNSHAQRSITYVIYITYRTLYFTILSEFLICNVLVSEIFIGGHFLEDCFYCYSQHIESAAANKSIISYNLIKKVIISFLGRKLLFIDMKLGTHTK